jgi:dTDP-4-amino-4,6-dideoxygalactose transaminase
VKIKPFDIDRDHLAMKEDLMAIVRDVLSSGEYILGPRVRQLEEAFAAYVGVPHAVGVANGTDAIRIAGLALGMKPGNRFITTPNTYIATVMALTTQGLVPRFCDVEPRTCTMDPDSLAEALEKEPDIKLCIPVHLYGHACPMDEILSVCQAHGVKVLEDACQAHGALYKGRRVGALGDAAAFSFYPTKNLGGYGDGGIVVTAHPETFAIASRLRNFGQEAKHSHGMEGFNSRLDELQAALIHHKLPHLDAWNDRRRVIAGWYAEALAGTPLVLPTEEPWAHHVYHLYVVRTPERARLQAHLADRGIGTVINYPTAIHLQGAYRSLGLPEGAFPVAEKAVREVISLPCYPSLTRDEVVFVGEAVKEFFNL